MGRRWVREETEGEGGERESDTVATAAATGAGRSYGRDKDYLQIKTISIFDYKTCFKKCSSRL
jgi:hypothetical protein